MRKTAAAGFRTRRGLFFRGLDLSPSALSGLILGLAASVCSIDVVAVTPPGTVIPNQASVSYTDPSGSPATTLSNRIDITTVVVRTDSDLQLIRVVSNGGTGTPMPVGPTACAVAGGSFVPLADPVLLGGQPIDPDAPQVIVNGDLFHVGEPLFVQLQDTDQNLDAAVRETVQVTVDSSPPGDSEVIRLTETAVDSGVFAGYIPTADGPAASGDCVLQLAQDGSVNGRYQDPVDPADSDSDVALVDPLTIVFDSRTGAPIDGVRITLIDVTTGQPAVVYGDDGTSSFPAEVTSGGSVFDGGGASYQFIPGGFRFPVVPPGEYRFELLPPVGYVDTSTASVTALQSLPGAPFALSGGSFGDPFIVGDDRSVNLDMPLDPIASELFLQKSTPTTIAAPGDFIQYVLTVENASANGALTNVAINDVLPLGFRYLDGSASIEGARAIDPTLSPDGRTLMFAVGDLASSESVSIRYGVEVTAGAHGDSATNHAVAVTDGGVQSNEATATVQLVEDLFRSKSFLMGRVILGSCDDDVREQLDGVAGVRIYLEDGRYAITDEGGRYHFEGLDPGNHVVQMDVEALPGHLEPEACDNSRFAGQAYSRFVDLEPGALWRADFYVRERPIPTGTVRLSLTSEPDSDADEIVYRLMLEGDSVPVRELKANVLLPAGLRYRPGSSSIDGSSSDDPAVTGPALSYGLGVRQDDWSTVIGFRAVVDPSADGELSTKALAIFDTPGAQGQRTPVAENLFAHEPRRMGSVQYRFSPRFGVLEAVLQDEDKLELDDVIRDWLGAANVSLVAVGHTDSTRIAPRNQHIFADNYALSLARAAAVARYVADNLGLDPDQVTVLGKGPDDPAADNATAEGRATNRRVELTLQGQRTVGFESSRLLIGDSGPVSVETRGAHQIDTLTPVEVIEDNAKNPIFADPSYIETLDPGVAWLAPEADFSPRIPSLKIAIKHAPDQLVELSLNGEPVGPLNFDGTEVNRAETVALSRWRGVDLEDGDNALVAVVRDEQAGETMRFERPIHFAGGPVRAIFVPESSTLVADGKTRPVIAVQLFDRWGHPARQATVGAFWVDPPYRSWWEVETLTNNQLVAVGDREPIYRVADNGLAYIELEPTTRTGEAVLHLKFPDDRVQDVRAWLAPAPRDWILVGLAEGTVGYNMIRDNAVNADDAGLEDHFYDDGRLAFFAKGQIKGEYLLTMAYDTARDRGEAEQRLFGTIDPNRYYPLYGDTTEQRFEAPSQRKLYLKLEREQFFALFGDFNTGLTVTDLARYNRSFNGLKSEFHGERFGYSAFATNTNQAFVKDQLFGDGTSGLYRLSRRPILVNSDKVTIEVRDRFRSEMVLESRELARFLDYDIDYVNGTLFFKQPVPSRDQNFNPVYIVVDYESRDDVDESTTAGGRAAFNNAGERLELGATVIHEGTVGEEGDLYGTDFRYQFSDVTELRAEYARSETVVSGTGDGYLAELSHGSNRLDGRIYATEQAPEFGLGQQSPTETGTRKYGADGRVRFSETLSLVGELYRQDNLESGVDRDVAQAELQHQNNGRSAALGLLSAHDEDPNGASQVSNQAFVNGSVELLDRLITLRGSADLSLGGDDANPAYPNRMTVGMDYRLTDSVSVFAEVESAAGASFDSLMTRAGVKTTPWNSAQLNSSVSHQMTEYGPRTFGTLGLIQGWQMNDHWAFDLGVDQAKALQTGDIEPFNVNQAPPSGPVSGEDFFASFVGALYRSEDWTFTSRLEYRNSESENRVNLSGGFYREQREGHGFSASLQLLNTEGEQGLDATNVDIRLGWAYRPSDSAWIVLDRLDLKYESRADNSVDLDSWRLVNNLNTNWMINPRTQLALQYGAKYVRSNLDSGSYTGYTDLFGTGLRRDLNRRWDVGVHANVLHSWRADVVDIGVGVDVGVTFAKNLWLSVGYNFAGFRDDDFAGGNYTAQGPFVTVRMKGDQDTGSGLKR